MQIKPQQGKQEKFLESSSDIVLYGGSAGGGKTYGLLLESVRNITVKGFGAVIFRTSLTQITKEGALWDTADSIYPLVGGRGVRGNLVYYWDKYGTKIDFSYLARDADLHAWQGTQIPLICFDELTHFSKKQFFYMLSRNRSVCGVKPYIRATTNPDPDSWVRKFIDWWIDDFGFAIESRSGVVRWFIHKNDEIFWFDRKIDACKKFPKTPPKSFSFITSNVYDNKILLEQDPDYIANLEALQRVDRERLLNGNWDVRMGAGDYFNRSNFEVVDALPQMKHIVRCWDLASTVPNETNEDPDWTVGMKTGVDYEDVFYVMDIKRDRLNPTGVEKLLKNTSTQDGKDVNIRIPQDPGSAGKVVAQAYIKLMAGYTIKSLLVSGDKEVRAKPASSQSGIGNIKVIRANWNEVFFDELEGFPIGGHDDMVDTLSDCIDELTDWRESFKVIKRPKILR